MDPVSVTHCLRDCSEERCQLQHVGANGAEVFRVTDEAVFDGVGADFTRYQVSARQEQRLDLRPTAALAHPLLPHPLVVTLQCVDGYGTTGSQVDLGTRITTATSFDLILRVGGRFNCSRGFGLVDGRTSRATVVVQLLNYGY